MEKSFFDEKKEISNFLKQKKFLYWKKVLEFYISKVTDTKVSKEEKHFWILKLYSLYLQFIEIFSINIFIITENKLLDNLFMTNKKLKNKIKTQLTSSKYIDYLLDKWVFGVEEKNSINNLVKKKNFYKVLINEIVKDYIYDQDLLNAYKHGFRVESKGDAYVKISEHETFQKKSLLQSYNSSIHYWSKKKGIIFENRLLFNWERIEEKFILIDNILDNTLKVFFANGKKVKLTHLYIDDPFKFNESYGISRIEIPIFTEGSKKK